MRNLFYGFRASAGLLLVCLASPSVGRAQTTLRIMTANLTSGNSQSYEAPGLHIIQGLHPDIVAIQEFNFSNNTPADFRVMIDNALGTNYSYFRETNAAYQPPGGLPNGIISRFPIIDAGSWDDPVISNRGFAWARIQLSATNELYVVSVHLYSGGTAGDRNTEALAIKTQILNNVPAGAWVVVAGDFNTASRDEPAIITFRSFLSDNPVPTDAEAGGNPNTNEGRTAPYDYVLPSFSFTNALIPVVLPSHTFSNGLVFDSRQYSPLSDVPPVAFGDSQALNMQHMAVVKDFKITTNGAPSILNQPKSQVAVIGSDVTFSVTAAGAPPLSYQWLFNGSPIAGATDTAYTRTNAQLPDGGLYSVIVSNTIDQVTSQSASLSFPSSTAGVFARWDFNSLTPDNNTATGTLAPSMGSGTASYVGGATGASGSAFATGTPNDPASTDNSGWNTSSYPAQGTANKTAGVRFDVSTVGKRDIVVRWEHRASNTASKYVRLQYTTNGSTFIDFPVAAIVVTNVFTPKTNDLSNVPGVNNNPNFGFRIVAEFESTAANTANANYVAAGTSYGTGGTLRFDLVSVSGNSLTTAPAQLSSPGLIAGGFRFLVSGTTGATYVVERATSLATPSWEPIFTNSAPFNFAETNLIDASSRFYRAVARP